MSEEDEAKMILMHADKCPTSEENDVESLALIWDSATPYLARHGGEPLVGLVVSELRVEAAEAPVHGEVGGAALVLGDLCTHRRYSVSFD